MPTNIYNTVEIEGKSYLIRKFDAKTGLKMARLLLAKAAPLIPYVSSADGAREDDMTIIMRAIESIDDDTIDAIVDKSLRVCSLMLPAGPQPIIDETGHYGVEDIEYDLLLTLRLCIEAIKWGAADFFGGSLSASSLKQKLLG